MKQVSHVRGLDKAAALSESSCTTKPLINVDEAMSEQDEEELQMQQALAMSLQESTGTPPPST